MSDKIKILGIVGSLRKASYNRAARRAAQPLVPNDATLEIFELDGIPGFNEDQEQNPPATVVDLKARVRAADAILFATPDGRPALRRAGQSHRRQSEGIDRPAPAGAGRVDPDAPDEPDLIATNGPGRAPFANTRSFVVGSPSPCPLPLRGRGNRSA